MLVALDVGNTNTVCGIYRGDELVRDFRLSTDTEKTADEYAALLLPLMARAGLDTDDVDAVVVCSVVPPLHATLTRLAREYFRREALFVEPGTGPGVDAGIPIRYDNPGEVGADRIVNGLAARELYGAPVVVVDFGTATTFDVVNRDGEYAGGIIAPGLMISAEALFAHAARLYEVDLVKPERLVGCDTSGAMQSGLYYGYIGLVDGILRRILDEMPDIRRVVATGGQAELIAEGSSFIQEVNSRLTLMGLKIIHDRLR